MAIFRVDCKGKQKNEVVAVRDMGTRFFLMEEITACLDTNGNDLVETEILIIEETEGRTAQGMSLIR